MQKTSSAVPIHDINLSAYLFFKGITPELRAEGGRVVFLFPNDEATFSLMEEYNGTKWSRCSTSWPSLGGCERRCSP